MFPSMPFYTAPFAGHTYRMNVTVDSDARAAQAMEEGGGSVGGFMASAAKGAYTGDLPLIFEFIDITKTK